MSYVFCNTYMAWAVAYFNPRVYQNLTDKMS